VSRGISGAGTLWGRGQNIRRLLVVAELALSVMLLVGAGLLIRSFARLQQVSPGFNATNVLTLELAMTGRQYESAERVLKTYRHLWERLGSLPRVTAAGGCVDVAAQPDVRRGPIVLEGRALPSGESFVNVDQRAVGGDYFRAMEIPLLRGRLFTEQDTRATPRVVVVDDHMAEVRWPGEDPIGKRLRRGGMDGAFVLTRFLRGLLFGVDARDPPTFAAIALILAVVAVLASYLPARHAARIDPLTSLRTE
jgi:hypothetical protein